MSVENEKVCCNCRHNIRIKDKNGNIKCYCNIIDCLRLTYNEVMSRSCRHWSKDKEAKNDNKIQ